METIGVIGAGVMGVGVSQCLAQSGYEVILVDISHQVLTNAYKVIKQNLRFQSLFNAQSDQKENINIVLDRIAFTEDYNRLAEVGFIIENVTEKWDIKKDLYCKLDKICSINSIFAANTSCISITRIASVSANPSRIVGLHFMNPVPLKPWVEVIYGYHTSQETKDRATMLLSSLGKGYIEVNDFPGFVSNRILMQFINEAIFEVQEGVAKPGDIDGIFKKCLGHKMGPLETADLIGLDTLLYSLEVLYESYKDGKFRPCPLLCKMVDAGLLGMKSGQGFYTYERYPQEVG